MNTPMAIESGVSTERSQETIIAEKDAQVPLGRKMGAAWDVAHAAAF